MKTELFAFLLRSFFNYSNLDDQFVAPKHGIPKDAKDKKDLHLGLSSFYMLAVVAISLPSSSYYEQFS